MSDYLSYEVAEECSKRLLGIPGFSWDEANIRATTEELMEMCRGAILDGRVWSAESQAHWLVKEMRARCVKSWQGPAAMQVVFREKFGREEKPAGEQYEVHDIGTAVHPECSECRDQGTVHGPDGKHRFCECAAGEATKTGIGESWLQLLDKTIRKAPTEYERRLESGQSFKRTRDALVELFGKSKKQDQSS
jgi:hypothetical protein